MRTSSWVLTSFLALSSPVAAEPRTHCTAQEESIWSCSARQKLYEVCASKDLGADGGYLQYRAGRPGESPELEFPGERVHPKGSFQFDLGASFATLSFTNGDYHYEIVESVQGGTTISVTRKGREPIVAVTCEAPSETLTLTSTIQRFEAIGLDR